MVRLLVLTAAASIAAVLLHTAPGSSTAPETPAAVEHTVIGRVLLPEGRGSRGVEVVATLADADGVERRRWILFDEEGRFSYSFQGSLVGLIVSTGIQKELVRFERDELAELRQGGPLDVGAIDLRGRLLRHRLLLSRAPGATAGDVRVGMCFGLPPVGPQGGRISLGSRQFPSIALGSHQDWLIPPGAQEIYFLVERPADSGSDGKWRSGRQQLFGPFATESLPSELIID